MCCSHVVSAEPVTFIPCCLFGCFIRILSLGGAWGQYKLSILSVTPSLLELLCGWFATAYVCKVAVRRDLFGRKVAGKKSFTQNGPTKQRKMSSILLRHPNNISSALFTRVKLKTEDSSTALKTFAVFLSRSSGVWMTTRGFLPDHSTLRAQRFPSASLSLQT